MNDSSVDEARLRRIDRFAWILDNSIPVPGTGVRIGLDGLIGLVPGLGDAVGALLSSYIIAQAAGAGASLSLVLRMVLNVAVESIVGLVPILGDLFDFAYKANARNVRLLRASIIEPARTRRRNRMVVAIVFLVVLAALIAFFLLGFAVARWAWHVISVA